MKSKLVAPLSLAAAVAALFSFQIEMASSQLSTLSTVQKARILECAGAWLARADRLPG